MEIHTEIETPEPPIGECWGIFRIAPDHLSFFLARSQPPSEEWDGTHTLGLCPGRRGYEASESIRDQGSRERRLWVPHMSFNLLLFCVYVSCVCSAQKRGKEDIRSPGTRVQTVVSCHMGAGWAISPAHNLPFLSVASGSTPRALLRWSYYIQDWHF